MGLSAHRFLFVVIAAVAMGSFAPDADACSCAYRPIEESFARADRVFIGDVLKRYDVGEEYLYVVKVVKIYKGASTETVDLISNKDGGLCGYFMRPGERHVIWIGRPQSANRPAEVHYCSRTESYAEAGDDIRWLEENTLRSGAR